MAKRNNKRDETPIEFHIPSMGKLPRAPILINQPNWVYKFVNKIVPTPVNIFAQVVCSLLFLGMVGFAFFTLIEYLQSWYTKATLLIFVFVALYIWGLLVIGSFNLYRQFKNKRAKIVFETKTKKKKNRNEEKISDETGEPYSMIADSKS